MKRVKTIIATIIVVLYSEMSFSQKIVQLSGVIINDNLQPLPFTHVLIKNKYQGTITNYDGYFSIPVASFDTIIFSYVGYKRKKIVIPDTIRENDYIVKITLQRDTIHLAEAIIYPWKNYTQFKYALLNYHKKDKNLEIAKYNLAIIKQQILSQEYMPNPDLNYKYFMQQYYDRMYYAGQYPPISILNPFAWAEFIKALKRGDFKKKE